MVIIFIVTGYSHLGLTFPLRSTDTCQNISTTLILDHCLTHYDTYNDDDASAALPTEQSQLICSTCLNGV